MDLSCDLGGYDPCWYTGPCAVPAHSQGETTLPTSEESVVGSQAASYGCGLLPVVGSLMIGVGSDGEHDRHDQSQ